MKGIMSQLALAVALAGQAFAGQLNRRSWKSRFVRSPGLLFVLAVGTRPVVISVSLLVSSRRFQYSAPVARNRRGFSRADRKPGFPHQCSPGCGVHANRVSPFSESIVAETMAVTMVL